MQFRRPELIPTLFIIASLVVLTSLGMWQLERLAWKEKIIAETQKAKEMPVLGTLPQDINDLTYRHVMLTGAFMYDKTIHLIGRQQGMDLGYYLVTPFKLEDDGRVILVNRGFSPLGKETKPEGIVTISGMLRPLREHRYFAPKNNPEKNVWSYEDLDLITQAVGQRPLPLVVEIIGQQENGIYPIPHEGTVVFRNDHLGYAVTWFGLALVSLVMFAAYYRKKQ